MKYVLAISACVGIFITYAIIGAALGWRHGGGLIPMLILFAAIGATWRKITKINFNKFESNNPKSLIDDPEGDAVVQQNSPATVIKRNEVQQCANCESEIGKLETVFEYQGQKICYDCNQTLNTSSTEE